MAMINGMYVFVENEDLGAGVEITSHPVEKGLNMSDSVIGQAKTLSIQGIFAGDTAYEDKERLLDYMYKGTLIEYVGAIRFNSALIKSIKIVASADIKEGYTFSADIVEVRIAGNSTTNSQNNTIQNVPKAPVGAPLQQVQQVSTSKEVYYTVKAGDTAYNLGENVFKSQGSSCAFITSNNANAVKNGDWTTLQIGTKILVALRK